MIGKISIPNAQLTVSNDLHLQVNRYSTVLSNADLRSFIWKVCKIFMGIVFPPLGIYWAMQWLTSSEKEKKISSPVLVPTVSLSKKIQQTISSNPKTAIALAGAIIGAMYALYPNTPSIAPETSSLTPLAKGSIFAFLALGYVCVHKIKEQRAIDKQQKLRKVLEEGYETSKQELQNGVSISEETIAKMQTCINSLLNRQGGDGVNLYNSQNNHRVFTIDTAPDLIFKMKAFKDISNLGVDDCMETRYKRMIYAQTVIRTYQLRQLVIPNAKLFTVKVKDISYEIIAEKKLDINLGKGVQEKYFQDDRANLAIYDLGRFISITGYSDVNLDNNPFLEDSVSKDDNWKIALIDLEEMSNADLGLFGTDMFFAPRAGLIGCLSEERGKMVEEIAKQNGIATTSFASAQARRKKEIEERKLGSAT